MSDESDRRAALALVPVSRETADRLAIYVDLLRRWQDIKNLVGPSTLQHIWTRHIADSAQLVGLASSDAKSWVDMGSGAGFPGLVIAILLRERAGAWVHLIESNGRKCAFLREVVRATGVSATVHAGRIEAVIPTLDNPVHVVTARALAPLPDLVAMAGPLLRRGAIGLFLKGGEVQDEMDRGENVSDDEFTVDSRPSVTHSNGRIIIVHGKVPLDGSQGARPS